VVQLEDISSPQSPTPGLHRIDLTRHATTCTYFPFLALFCTRCSVTHSLTAALDQLRVVAFSTWNDPGPRSGQHQQIGQCLLALVAANFFVDDPAGAAAGVVLVWASIDSCSACEVGVFSSRRQMCDQIMNDVCQQ